MDKHTQKEYNKLAGWLAGKGRAICADNKCNGENHSCESFAYVAARLDDEDLTGSDLEVLDICASDYFQGFSREGWEVICLPMPFEGDGSALIEALQRYRD